MPSAEIQSSNERTYSFRNNYISPENNASLSNQCQDLLNGYKNFPGQEQAALPDSFPQMQMPTLTDKSGLPINGYLPPLNITNAQYEGESTAANGSKVYDLEQAISGTQATLLHCDSATPSADFLATFDSKGNAAAVFLDGTKMTSTETK
jgi:hypothetical protein